MTAPVVDAHERRWSVLVDVSDERDRQDAKWGTSFPGRPWDRWLTILTEEVGELAEAILEAPHRDLIDAEYAIRRELVQIAAVAVSALEHGPWKDRKPP